MVRPTSVMILGRREALALGALGLPLTALSSQIARAAGDTIRIAFPAPVATLDPAKMRVGGLEYNYAYYVFSRLTHLNTKLQVEPDLATSWEPSADLKSWTFKLRPDVKFHNGKTLTAGDVVFTYKRLQDKEVGSVLRASLDFVTKVEAVDPLTVQFTLSIPYGDLPALTAGYQAQIVCESAMDTITTRPVGTGPFRFVEYKPGDRMILERNPDYFVAGVPVIDKAILQIIPEATTAVAGLQSGALDVVYDLPPELVDRVKKSNAAGVEEVTTGTWHGIIMNCDMKPFDNPKVRQAVALMVDKPAFADIATFGHGTPTVAPIPPTHPYFRKDLLTAQDIPAARKLLAEAGYPNGFVADLFVPGQSPGMERLATAFRDVAKQVGITVNMRIIPQDKFFAEMEGKVPFNIDSFFGRPTPDLSNYAWYHSKGSWNNTLWHYKNDEVDHLLETARATADKSEQAKLYGRFQEIVSKDGPGVIVYVATFPNGISKKVQNLAASPLMLLDIAHASFA